MRNANLKLMRRNKIFFTILIVHLSFSLAFCQSNPDVMKMWNSESVRIGNTMKDEIDSKINKAKQETKVLISNYYQNGILTIYKTNDEINKMTKAYSRDSINFKEDYYFSGRWPLYVEIKGSTSKLSNKFYFDKTNLMVWITENNEYLNVGDKNAGDKWFELLKQIDKLNLIAKMSDKTIKEDDVKLPEP